MARLLQAQVAGLRRVVTVAELSDSGRRAAAGGRSRSDDIAFMQYTSGSTGDPKGVVLTHANLLANIRAMGQAIDVQPDDVFVSWLPLYHDMGLIGAWLASLYFAIPLVVMSPLAFLARPERWLRAIQRHRGTLSAAPNFAYELCVKRIDDAQIDGLDLSSLAPRGQRRRAGQPETLRRFAERFAPLWVSAGGDGAGLRAGRMHGRAAFRRSAAGRASTASAASRFSRAGRAEPAAARRCQRAALRLLRTAAARPRGAHRRRPRPRAG